MCKTTVITEVNIPRHHLFVLEPTCITINIGCRPRHTLAHTRIVARPQTHTRIPVSGSSMLDQEYQSLQSVRKKTPQEIVLCAPQKFGTRPSDGQTDQPTHHPITLYAPFNFYWWRYLKWTYRNSAYVKSRPGCRIGKEIYWPSGEPTSSTWWWYVKQNVIMIVTDQIIIFVAYHFRRFESTRVWFWSWWVLRRIKAI